MKYKYWSVYEYDEEGRKRRIYTFDNAMAAHELLEFILQKDFMPSKIKVEEHTS